MATEIQYVVPLQSIIELPAKMRPGGDLVLRSFHGIWCAENENNGPNLTDTARLLIMLGLIQARVDNLSALSQRKPPVAKGGGHTDIGQVTKDGKFGLSLVIQTLWPDENRTAAQLRDEIQWLVFHGFETLEAESDQTELIKKFTRYIGSSAPDVDSNSGSIDGNE